jgi:hypothetical protein
VPDADEGLLLHPPRRRESGPPANRLHKTHRIAAHFRLRTEHLESHTRHDDVLDTEAEGRRSDITATAVAVTHDLPILDVDPGLQLVRLAVSILIAQNG